MARLSFKIGRVIYFLWRATDRVKNRYYPRTRKRRRMLKALGLELTAKAG